MGTEKAARGGETTRGEGFSDPANAKARKSPQSLSRRQDVAMALCKNAAGMYQAAVCSGPAYISWVQCSNRLAPTRSCGRNNRPDSCEEHKSNAIVPTNVPATTTDPRLLISCVDAALPGAYARAYRGNIQPTCDQRSSGAVFSSKVPSSASSRIIERLLGGSTSVSTCGGSHWVLSLVG